MPPKNIIEICLALDTAILGLAYPIILDKISSIGEKYSSQYIPVIFNNEFPQKTIELRVGKKQIKLSYFKAIIYLTFISFPFIIFSFSPILGWDNYLINNSAQLVVLLSTTILVIFFFVWIDKVSLYNGKSTTLLRRLISKYNNIKKSDDQKYYLLKAINELTIYALDKQDEHLQETLLEFYFQEFLSIRKNHNKAEPLIYPIDLYFLVYKLNNELVYNKNRKLPSIEHRAVSGIWLLGEDFEQIIISDETYNWLWQNLCVICDNSRLIKMFWANSTQYFSFQLKSYAQKIFINNELVENPQFKQRDNERIAFLEFHFALGGLLLYRRQYEAIKYMFEYTQSIPPRYILLPSSMDEIFHWLEYFSNKFKGESIPIDIKYGFPDLDNLGTRRQVNFWICSYLALLFIRQYSLDIYFVYQDFKKLPSLPDEIVVLSNWLDNVKYFEICLQELLRNESLLSGTDLASTVLENGKEIQDFGKKLQDKILSKMGQQRLAADLSQQKIHEYLQNTNEIISAAFREYMHVFNSNAKHEIDLTLFISGGIMLMSKSAFIDDEIQHFDYEKIFAEQISNNNIRRIIPGSFVSARTRRYLLSAENIIRGLTLIIQDNPNANIIGVNISYQIKDLIINSKFRSNLKLIPSSHVRDTLFVLNDSDLPIINHKDLSEEEIRNLKLTKINDRLNLYASIIDINKPENKNIKDTWKIDKNDFNLDLQVQLAISFECELSWVSNRDVIQINIATQFKEQGIQDDLNDIVRLRKD